LPREFDLLWRLAEAPGSAVSAEALLNDVWRLSFRPETNSLAVHVSRLRAKLRLAGLDGLIETLPDGSYRLALGAARLGSCAKIVTEADKLALDAYLRLGKEQGEKDHQAEGREQDHAT
ncbi:MAG: winged helix-turn-helix domain-containing protein, partial [Sphingomonadales bacterium]|nr:winged helix-turn-helix domain-containing protein [Sphingomonadales bacterium]